MCTYEEVKAEMARCQAAYTPQEIELNRRLFEACCEQSPDFALVEELLRQGADPLGPYSARDVDILEHLYGELVCVLGDDEHRQLPRITELFLRYGMKVEQPRIPYDDSWSIHPMWCFGLYITPSLLAAFRILLDHGISVDAASEAYRHQIGDLICVNCDDPNSDPFWRQQCEGGMKMLLLCASYDGFLEQDEWLRRFLCCDRNHYDVRRFRDIDAYEFAFDTSRCAPLWSYFSKCVVTVTEKASGQEVWRVGVDLEPDEF